MEGKDEPLVRKAFFADDADGFRFQLRGGGIGLDLKVQLDLTFAQVQHFFQCGNFGTCLLYTSCTWRSSLTVCCVSSRLKQTWVHLRLLTVRPSAKRPTRRPSTVSYTHLREVRDTSLRVPHGAYGIIVDVKVFTPENSDELQPGVREVVSCYIDQKRKISVCLLYTSRCV